VNPTARGFTLIELLISTALAMILAGVAMTAFYRFRNIIARTEARMAMHASAQRLYTRLHASFSCLQPTCAIAARTTTGSEVRLVFMRAKENTFDFLSPAKAGDFVASDLTWEEWVWSRGDRTLRTASNTIGTASSPGRSFASGSFSPLGINYSGKTFWVLPQPRRRLDPADPFATLDDNILFPDASGVSRANATDDLGDFADLERNLAPALAEVSDLSLELVARDGSVVVLDDSASAVHAIQGVWPDGRLAPTLAAAPAYATSEVAKRPRLVRLRLTLENRPLELSSTFSFSFALPDLSASR